MTVRIAGLAALFVVIVAGLLVRGGAAQTPAAPVEVALVANAEGGTIAVVDVASRAIVGAIDVNPARAKSVGPGAPNFAQDTDVSPDGRTLYVSRGYLGDVAAFDLASGRLLWQRPLNTMRADHMTVTPDGRSLFVSAMVDDRVYRVATANGEITGEVLTVSIRTTTSSRRTRRWSTTAASVSSRRCRGRRARRSLQRRPFS